MWNNILIVTQHMWWIWSLAKFAKHNALVVPLENVKWEFVDTCQILRALSPPRSLLSRNIASLRIHEIQHLSHFKLLKDLLNLLGVETTSVSFAAARLTGFLFCKHVDREDLTWGQTLTYTIECVFFLFLMHFILFSLIVCLYHTWPVTCMSSDLLIGLCFLYMVWIARKRTCYV